MAELTKSDVANILLLIKQTTPWELNPSIEPEKAAFWRLDRVSDERTQRRITVYAGISQNCLCFQLPTSIYVLPECAPIVRYYLLELNTHLRMAKFGIDENEDIYLLLELLGISVNLQTVRASLDALLSYFENFYREIEIIGSDSQLAHLWFSLASQSSTENMVIDMGSVNGAVPVTASSE